MLHQVDGSERVGGGHVWPRLLDSLNGKHGPVISGQEANRPLTRAADPLGVSRGLLFLSLIALMVSGVTPNMRQSKLRNATIWS